MKSPVEIVGAGVVCAAGLCTAQAAASARAGLSRVAESFFFDRAGEPLMMGLVAEEELPPLPESMDELEVHERRRLRLALPALAEANPAQPRPIYLGLDEAVTAEQGRRWLDWLVPGVVERSRTFPRGRASGLLALETAVAAIREGREEIIVVGGVDSYVDRPRLAKLEEAERLRAGPVHDGFVPGEGAAFVVLARPGLAKPWASVLAAASGLEPGHVSSEAPHRAEGLSTVCRRLADELPGAHIRSVWSGFNGESFWAHEWGVARLRLGSFIAEPSRFEHPMEVMGDPGAALGPLLVALAAHGLQRSVMVGPSLVFCGSDGEDRAAVVLSP